MIQYRSLQQLAGDTAGREGLDKTVYTLLYVAAEETIFRRRRFITVRPARAASETSKLLRACSTVNLPLHHIVECVNVTDKPHAVGAESASLKKIHPQQQYNNRLHRAGGCVCVAP
jgi:hypothetical protein